MTRLDDLLAAPPGSLRHDDWAELQRLARDCRTREQNLAHNYVSEKERADELALENERLRDECDAAQKDAARIADLLGLLYRLVDSLPKCACGNRATDVESYYEQTRYFCGGCGKYRNTGTVPWDDEAEAAERALRGEP